MDTILLLNDRDSSCDNGTVDTGHTSMLKSYFRYTNADLGLLFCFVVVAVAVGSSGSLFNLLYTSKSFLFVLYNKIIKYKSQKNKTMTIILP